MAEKDITEERRTLLKQLNYFMLHVVAFFFSNLLLVIHAFQDIESRIAMLFITGFWALALMYHGFWINGFNLFRLWNKSIKKVMVWFKFAAY